MAGNPVVASMRVIGLKEIQAKLVAAGARILAENRAMVQATLEAVKAEIEPGTPVGPGHFGMHLRSSYKIVVSSSGTRTTGGLKAPPQGYWREFGTRGRNVRVKKLERAFGGKLAGFGSGGEKAGLFATTALSHFQRIIREFYGKSLWWHL